MEKRTLLALVLVAIVIVVTPRVFPGKRNSTAPGPDTARAEVSSTLPERADSTYQTPSVSPPREPEILPPTLTATTVRAEDSVSTFVLSSAGASLSHVVLRGYDDLKQRRAKIPVELSTGTDPIVSYGLVTSRDTIDLRKAAFSVVEDTSVKGVRRYAFSTTVRGTQVTISYAIRPDSFLARVSGSITGSDSTGEPRYLVVHLPKTLQSYEADTTDDQHHLAFAYRPSGSDGKSLPFGKLDPGEKAVVSGPLTWVVAKDKYFLVGLLAPASDSGFAEFSAVGGIRASRTATHADGRVLAAIANGRFEFEIYAGPQHWRRMSALGREFQNSNPYGGFLQPVVQPFATIVMKILLWMRENLKINYGWVLVIFGIVVRLVLWPLNQKGMRASMKMQRIQPELNEIQKRYKNDPQKLQSEMMRVYKDHNMSPFSTFAGCLPLFLPLPILFALFFVFQNTIEFRGVPFLWFHDISQKDPLYIVPLTMGISMFALSWIGMRNTPPNPQTKAMTYIFPVMMTVLFANFPAGLNMYYTIQNLAALPQQWFIANERAKSSVLPGKKQP